MTLDQFWNIIQEVHLASNGNMDAKCKLLDKRLRQLPVDEVRSFGKHFKDLFHRGYTWELWAAAHIIGHGCSDDSFMDFRSTLISMGRKTFEDALVNPESLVEINYDSKIAHYEGYQYVASKVYKDLGGPNIQHSESHSSHSNRPSGQEWDEDNVAEFSPKLAKKYNFQR